MKITSPDLLKLKVVDEVIKEPLGGAHKNHDETAKNFKKVICKHFKELAKLSAEELMEQRYERFRALGAIE